MPPAVQTPASGIARERNRSTTSAVSFDPHESFAAQSSRHMPQIWSPLLTNIELISAVASFWTLATLMAIEVVKRVFLTLSPRSP